MSGPSPKNHRAASGWTPSKTHLPDPTSQGNYEEISREEKMNEAIARIARDKLGINTLETRNSDALDFHDLSTWQIKEALENANRAGARGSKQPGEPA
jgi:hypothetical protein